MMARHALRPLAGLLGFVLCAAMPAGAAAQDAPSDFDFSTLEIPDGFLDLADVVMTARPGGGSTVTATTTLMNAETSLLVATGPGVNGGKRRMTLGLMPREWSLTKSIPALANPVLDQLTLSNVGLVMTGDDVTSRSGDLTPEEYAFYREIFRRDEFEFRLKPGINLIAVIPLADLEADNPLLPAMDALGIEKGDILLQGALGKSLALIGGKGVPSANVIKDLYLRAELPAMRPPGAPDWFQSGQLAFEITGDPSVRLVGELTVKVEDDVLLFFVSAMVAKTGMSLAGGLISEEGWDQPFGIEWLIMKEVILKIGITPAGSIQLGFGGDMVIGEKDIDVAVAVALNAATGVPTNFIFDGNSEAGVGMPDLVALQGRMAGDRTALIPVGALPQIAFKKIALKFAPKPEPDLGIERGMAIKGRMWLQTSPQGELVDFAGVDVSVSDDGLTAKGDIAAFTLGPLVFEEAVIDLTATRDEQHFIIKGEAQLFASRQLLDVSLSREGFSFTSETRLFDLFSADLTAQAKFDLKSPAFKVQGIAQNDFSETMLPLLTEGFVGFARGGDQVLADAGGAMAELDRLLADQTATVDQIRAGVVALRAEAAGRLQQAQNSTAQAARSMSSAKQAYDAAVRARQSTYAYQVGLMAQRRAVEATRRVQYVGARSAYIARAALASGAQQVLAALPPVDQSVAVVAAEAALAELRTRVQGSRDRLTRLQSNYTSLIDAVENGQPPVTIRTASFSADLEQMMQGQAMQWAIEGTYVGQPFALQRDINFSDPGTAAAEIVASLMGR